MPLQMGKFKDLDVLSDFVVGKGSGSRIAELKELKYIRGELCISGLQNISHPEDALEANLKEKSRLEELTLKWEHIDSDNSENARIILENLRPYLNLKKLFIRWYSGTRLPDWLVQNNSFVNLVDVAVVGFKHCIDLSPLGQLPSLKSLLISNCDSLKTLVSTEIPAELANEIHHHIGHFSALVKLDIYDCPKLELPQQHHCFTSIEKLTVQSSCASLQLFPLSIFPKLNRLCLYGLQSIESLAVIDEANNFNLQYLDYIEIRRCPKLKFFPVSLFPKLKDLHIGGCKKLIANRSNWSLQKMLSLSTFQIGDFKCDDLEYFPEEGLLPSSLTSFEIGEVPNLTNLNGKSFQLLTCLETLELRECPILQCLPQLPNSLSTLRIHQCSLLKSRCQREQGEDWSKIAHIPNIHVD